jgi:hypothetical protein
MDVSQLRRLNKLEAENSKLKRLYAEPVLTRHDLQGVVSSEPMSARLITGLPATRAIPETNLPIFYLIRAWPFNLSSRSHREMM